jgi:hypothetical protein
MNTNERANHSRWCVKNPKHAEYLSKNNGSQFQTIESITKRTAGIKQAHIDGKYIERNKLAKGKPGTPHTEKTKQYLKEKALASSHRRLVRSIRKYTKKDGSVVSLDSSWEEALAIRLDEIGINWIRPDPIKWIDNTGVVHNYFPDFYLTDFDIYLDPKNPYAIKAQQNKLKCLTEQIKNLKIIKGLDECKKYDPRI